MPNYEEIIQQSQKNVIALSEKIDELDKFHEDIKMLIKQPEIFEMKFQEIIMLTEDYTNLLGKTTKTYLDGNNSLFSDNLKELSDKTNELQGEIGRLVGTDLEAQFQTLQLNFLEQTREDFSERLNEINHKSEDLQLKINEFRDQITRLENTDLERQFQSLQQIFLEQTREDITEKLKEIDRKSEELQSKIDDFKDQITRLEQIDPEKQFVNYQESLSEIAGKANLMGETLSSTTEMLSSISQSLATIDQRLNTVQNAIEANLNEIKQQISGLSNTVSSQLDNRDNKIKQQLESLKEKMDFLTEENRALKAETKKNRTFQIVEILMIVILIIYLFVR